MASTEGRQSISPGSTDEHGESNVDDAHSEKMAAGSWGMDEGIPDIIAIGFHPALHR
jgi:hypothetical protein